MRRTVSNRHQNLFSNTIFKEQTKRKPIGTRNVRCSSHQPRKLSCDSFGNPASGRYASGTLDRVICSFVIGLLRQLTPVPLSSVEPQRRVSAMPEQLGRGHLGDDKRCHSLPDCDHSALQWALQRIDQIFVSCCRCMHLQNGPAGLEN